MSDDGETLSVGQYVDRTIGLLEKAEGIRLDAQRKAQDAAASGDRARLRDDPSSVLGSGEELNTLKYQFDAMARPLVQVAYALDIDAAPLDDFIRTDRLDLVGDAIRVLRRVQGEALKRQVPAIQQSPKSAMIQQIERRIAVLIGEQRKCAVGVDRVTEAVQSITSMSEQMKQACIEALAEQGKSDGPPKPPQDPTAPYMPADWFKTQYGIPAERLRSAYRWGKLARIQPDPRFRRYHYSVPDAQREWPDDAISMPDLPAETGWGR